VGKGLVNALALHRRGEVRSDGLALLDASIKLYVSWRARDIHPWDRDLPEERAARRLLEQTFHDTEAAVGRIFSQFPEATTVELKVFESDPASNRVIMSGLVERSDVGRCKSSSISMRLHMLGINYRVENQRLAVIGTVALPLHPTRIASRDFESGRSGNGAGRQADLAMKSRLRWRDDDHGPQ